MAIKHAKVNGAELTYRVEGDGPPVVLLNGFLGDYRGWHRQVDALSPQHRVIALSQRYFPPNKWPDDGAGFGPATFVADLVLLLRQLGVPPVHLIGHSYGGGVAARLAAEHPELVRTLVLGEPALQNLALDHPAMSGLLNEFMEMRKASREAWQRGDNAGAVEAELIAAFDRTALDRIRAEHFAFLLDSAPIVGAASRMKPPPPFTMDMAHRLTMPVLIVEGARTKALFSITCAKLAACLPNVERVVLPDTSRALHLESPDPFNEALLRFYQRH